MYYEPILDGISYVTKKTLIGVVLHVSLDLNLTGKYFVTSGTWIWLFFPHMDFHNVFYEFIRCNEFLLTHGTLGCMGSLMIFEKALRGKSFSTCGTLMGLLPSVD